MPETKAEKSEGRLVKKSCVNVLFSLSTGQDFLLIIGHNDLGLTSGSVIHNGDGKPFEVGDHIDLKIADRVGSFGDAIFSKLIAQQLPGKLTQELPVEAGGEIIKGIAAIESSGGSVGIFGQILCLGRTHQPVVVEGLAAESGVDRLINKILRKKRRNKKETTKEENYGVVYSGCFHDDFLRGKNQKTSV